MIGSEGAGVQRGRKKSTFMKLMETLVETVLLYGAEVWGCGGQLRPV